MQTAQNDIGAFKSTTFDIPTQAKPGILESIIPELLAGRASVYKPGDPTQRQSGDEASNVDEEILKAIYDTDKGKIRHDAVGLKYAQVGPGYTAAGYQIDTPKGSIVVVDQNAQRREWSKMMESAVNPIFMHGKTRGAKGIMGINQKTGLPQLGTPEMRYHKVDGKWEGDLYWDVDPGVYEMKNLPQIQQEMIHIFGGALGYGQSKSDATPYSYFFNQ